MNCIFELSLLVIKDKPKRYPYNVMVWQRAIFCTYDDADTYIRDNIEDWHVLDIFCIYVREKPVGSMLYEEECLAVWLYDERGNLIDKRLCSNIGMSEEFQWRRYEDLRFHPGDIVEVLENDEVYLAYLPGPAMSKEDIEHYNEFVSDKVSDASDDIYTILTSESYDSHQHIDALHVFTPHLKIHPSTSKRFRKIYEANLLNGYKT